MKLLLFPKKKNRCQQISRWCERYKGWILTKKELYRSKRVSAWTGHTIGCTEMELETRISSSTLTASNKVWAFGYNILQNDGKCSKEKLLPHRGVGVWAVVRSLRLTQQIKSGKNPALALSNMLKCPWAKQLMLISQQGSCIVQLLGMNEQHECKGSALLKNNNKIPHTQTLVNKLRVKNTSVCWETKRAKTSVQQQHLNPVND